MIWLNLILFQIGWFGCVLGASNGISLLGPGIVALSSLQVLVRTHPRREFQFLCGALMMGIVCDAFLISTQAIQFQNGNSIAPVWMWALWANLALTFSGCMRWLRNRFFVGALLGAIGGPLCYLAGARLGALHIDNERASLPAISVVWALAIPALQIIHAKLIPEEETSRTGSEL